MEWNTRITKLLGCKYPILEGAMARFGTWQFAAAVAQAGGHGTITAGVSQVPELVRDDIIQCRKATAGAPGTFGVNLSIGLVREIERVLEVCIEERVPIETSVYKPDALAARIKASGLPWIHKAARVKDAVHAVDVGADAIILVGLEGAGIKNPEQLPTMTTMIWGRKHIRVPLIASGGIGDAHGLMAALGMGADGIMMGTAFMLTRECSMPDKAKEKLLQLRPDNAEFRNRVMTATPWRPGAPTAAPSAQPPRETRNEDYDGEVSFAASAMGRIPTVKELIEGMMRDAEAILDGWEFLKSR